MKNIRVMYILLLMVIAMLFISSCGKKDTEGENTTSSTARKETNAEKSSLSEKNESDKEKKPDYVLPDNIKAGDVVIFGCYEQDANLSNGDEPIEWDVISVDDEKAFMVSKYVLDRSELNDSRGSISWKDCTLRKWLNGEFYNRAFTSYEKEIILSVDNNNPDNPKYGTSGGENTSDKVFLLSIDDITNKKSGFSSDCDNRDIKRRCSCTEYAKQRGLDRYPLCHQIKGLPLDEEDCKTSEGLYTSYYWLRTPGKTAELVCLVEVYGTINLSGIAAKRIEGYQVWGGVRPAIVVRLEKSSV